MKNDPLPGTDTCVSRIAYGCSMLSGAWDDGDLSKGKILEAERMIAAAREGGINLFDLADVYAFGKAEAAFGAVLKASPGLRDQIVIQSKCGIRFGSPLRDPQARDPHHMDSSYAHIIASVEQMLRRLGTDYLDILLLHRPDALADPAEIAQAFDALSAAGKVRHFGVSNHAPGQIELLRKFVSQPLRVNQLQIGLGHPHLVTEGIDFNRTGDKRFAGDYAGAADALDYCRANGLQIQAWSPLRGIPLTPPDADAAPGTVRFHKTLSELAEEKGVTCAAIAVAWLLRHPAGIVPVIGATKSENITGICAADSVELSRAEWYGLLTHAVGAGGTTIL